jgi:hypothetical protein
MAYRIMTYATTNTYHTIAAVYSHQFLYSDAASSLVMSTPQSKEIQIDNEGYVTSATVNIAGGADVPTGGISTGGWGFLNVAADVEATGFRPNAQVDITGYGPSGGESFAVTADNTGTVRGAGGLLRYTDADFSADSTGFIQAGQKIPGGTITVTERDSVLAYIAPFPHPLYNEPLYMGYGADQLQYRHFTPKSYGASQIQYQAFRPGAYKTYSESVNIGPGIEDHPTTEASTLSGSPCPGRFFINFNINFKERRARNKLAQPGDAVVIWPGDRGNLSVNIDSETERALVNRMKNPAAYVIEAESGKLVSTGNSQYGRRYYNVRAGESLIISSASFGSRADQYPAYYTDASNPQIAFATLNEGADRKAFFDISTRPLFRRSEFGFSRWLKAHEPGIVKLKVEIF